MESCLRCRLKTETQTGNKYTKQPNQIALGLFIPKHIGVRRRLLWRIVRTCTEGNVSGTGTICTEKALSFGTSTYGQL